MARIKASPEDFVVEEIPAYEPSGEGEHLFVRFKKRERTTDEVVRELGRALGVHGRDIGVAGLKDKVGVTTQTISIPLPRATPKADFEARVGALALEGVSIEDARWHKNKLKTGHLRGNRFDIVVRELDDAEIDGVLARFEEIGRLGVPNLFGPQRFGEGGRNVERAKAWLSGADRPPRDAKARRFSFSAWQSWIFNQVLERRLADGTWAGVVEGDLLQKHATGGLFLCTDVQVDQERARALEISATGPMVGDKMRWPEGNARKLEEEVVGAALADLGKAGDEGFLATHATLGEGTRRPLRQHVTNLETSRELSGSIRVQFVLPSGAYATTVLGRAISDLKERADATPRSEEERTELSS